MKISPYHRILALWIILFVICSCSSSNNGEPSIETILTKHISSRNFDYFMMHDDHVDTVFQEKYLTWLLAQLKIDSTEKITFYKLKHRQQMTSLVGVEANAYANIASNKLYTIWPTDNHETVHLILCGSVGCPPPLFGEGVAVAYQASIEKDNFIPRWNGENFHVLSKTFYKSKTLPSLDSLLGIHSFWNVDLNIAYPVTGSFTRYIIDTHGIEKFKTFIYSKSYTDTPDTIRAHFVDNYHFNLDSAWSDWIKFVEKYEEK